MYLVLSNNLRFEQLSISSGSTGAVISLTQSRDVLAILTGVEANTITRSSFTMVQ